MGSFRRAAIRREQKERSHIKERMDKGYLDAYIKKAYTKGHDEGMVVATAIILMALNEEYGWVSTPNSKGRLDKVIDRIKEESINIQREPTRFKCDYYIKLLAEKTGIKMEP